MIEGPKGSRRFLNDPRAFRQRSIWLPPNSYTAIFRAVIEKRLDRESIYQKRSLRSLISYGRADRLVCIGLETIKKYYRVDRSEISYLKFILEAYEGLASLTTLDAAAGTVRLHIAPGCLGQVRMILESLKKEILMEELERSEAGKRVQG